MNKANLNIMKSQYITPEIKRIEIDNEISLSLESDQNPESDPTFISVYGCFKSDPFKADIT